MMPVKRLSLTDFKVSIPRGAREKTLKLALNKDGVMAKWARSEMIDFDRFKLMVAKKKRSWLSRRR